MINKKEAKRFVEWPYSDTRERELVNEVFDSGKWWRMTGTKVKEFEKKFAKYHECKYCLGVTNGTHALELALTALEIGNGDEVIVPAITFISTASAVVYCSATPIFVDVDSDTYCMKPEEFEKAITPKTKAVIPVHMAGHACDMDTICSIAKKHNIKIIEDAAHGHGGMYKEKKIGSIGDISIFSFQNGKIMTCGEGGAIITNDQNLYEKAFLIHGVGRPENDTKYEHKLYGSNYRMNEFQAAILIAQLERLEEMNIRRQRNANLLNTLLNDIEGIKPQVRKAYATTMTYYMYMFYYDKDYFNDLNREDFIKYLNSAGIPAFICFPVLSEVEAFKKNRKFRNTEIFSTIPEENLQNSHELAKRVVWIPHFTLLGEELSIEYIADVIKNARLERGTK